MREVKEGLKLVNLSTDHVMIQSELEYLIGAKIVDLKCRVFGGKTAAFRAVRVFRVVRPVATVRFRVEPNPEPTREFGPVANTACVTRVLPIRMGLHPANGCKYCNEPCSVTCSVYLGRNHRWIHVCDDCVDKLRRLTGLVIRQYPH